MTTLYLGLLSGTSIDAIDVALVDMQERPRLLRTLSHRIPPRLRERVVALSGDSRSPLETYAAVDTELGQAFAEAALALIDQAGLRNTDIRAIGSHGQTVLHAPQGSAPNSLQIGNPNVIVERTGITTIADFRRRDIAAGGQGAPLVPIFHRLMFQAPGQARAIVNIGGIANITFLPSVEGQPVLGFDCGPGNTLLDQWIGRHKGVPYDADGRWAASGQCSRPLLEQLQNDPFFAKAAPKSTGKEYFGLAWLDRQLQRLDLKLAAADVQATLVQLTAATIANALRALPTDPGPQVFFCGGGVHNPLLMNALAQALNIDHAPATTATLGVDPDWVEASAFAWLAHLTLTQQCGNLPSVTGAAHAAVLGAIYHA